MDTAKAVARPEVAEIVARRPTASPHRRFNIVLIKTSHYDDDGYVVRAFRSSMPANSLATVYVLVADCAVRDVLGRDVRINLTAIDGTNKRLNCDKLTAEMRRNGNFGMVGLVGIQSNQFPRALDIARLLRAAGIPVQMTPSAGRHKLRCLLV